MTWDVYNIYYVQQALSTNVGDHFVHFMSLEAPGESSGTKESKFPPFSSLLLFKRCHSLVRRSWNCATALGHSPGPLPSGHLLDPCCKLLGRGYCLLSMLQDLLAIEKDASGPLPDHLEHQKALPKKKIQQGFLQIASYW